MKTETAMTLTEVLVALAITSMLVVGAMRATTALSRSSAAMEVRHEQSDRQAAMEHLFAVAHTYSFGPLEKGFALQTRGYLDEQLELRHMPAEVTYKVRKIEERNWLVRTQRVGDTTHRELVCCDVLNVEIGGVGGMSAGAGNRGEMPDSIAVTVTWENPQQELRFSCILK